MEMLILHLFLLLDLIPALETAVVSGVNCKWGRKCVLSFHQALVCEGQS